MRYPAFFISTNDPTIKFRRPGRVNVSINADRFKIELFKTIPLERITAITIQHDVSDKELSAGKAIAGAVLAGGVGAIAGAAMGGKKVSSMLTVSYANERGEACEVALDIKLAYQIKEKFERYQARKQATVSSPQQHTKPTSSSLRRGLTFYYTWPYQLLKKLTNK